MGPVGVSLIYKALCLLSLLPPRPFATLDSSAHSPLVPAVSRASLSSSSSHSPPPHNPRPQASSVCHEGTSTGRLI